MRRKSDNPNNDREGGDENCSICRDFLVRTERFFDMLQRVRRPSASDWLTVGEVASELRISKTIVYRLVRSGELEAVDIAETNGRIAQRGHYRIKRTSLNRYLESKKVRPFPNQPIQKSCSRRFPKIKNHLGL